MHSVNSISWGGATVADVKAERLGSLFDNAWKSQTQSDAARCRKLARLRQAVDLAEDPTDIFEATTELIEAIVGDAASLTASSSEPTATTTAATHSPAMTLCDDAEYPPKMHSGPQQAQDQQVFVDPLLALKLCAALSAPAIKGAAATNSPMPGRAGAGAADYSPAPYVQHGSPYQATPAAGVSQLHQSFSSPAAMDADLELCSEGMAARVPSWTSSSGLAILGGMQAQSNKLSPTHHQPARARSTMQLQELLQQHRQRKQLQQQQQVQDRAALYQLLCSQLEGEQHPAPQQQVQQQQHSDLEQQKAALLSRLQRAIAVCAVRNGMDI